MEFHIPNRVVEALQSVGATKEMIEAAAGQQDRLCSRRNASGRISQKVLQRHAATTIRALDGCGLVRPGIALPCVRSDGNERSFRVSADRLAELGLSAADGLPLPIG